MYGSFGNAGGMQAAPKSAPTEPPIGHGVMFDLEKMLSLELIRQHTKTEDIPAVTDEQLVLYRKAAFGAAEKYTGMLFMEKKRVEEPILLPRNYTSDYRKTFTHRTRYQFAESPVYVYGPGVAEVLYANVGSKKITFQNIFASHEFFSCCRTCGPKSETQFKILYVAGYGECEAVPAGIIMGALKYIAWTVENPGDVLKTVDNKSRQSGDFMRGTNNAAFASGAIEEWRMYVDDPTW